MILPPYSRYNYGLRLCGDSGRCDWLLLTVKNGL